MRLRRLAVRKQRLSKLAQSVAEAPVEHLVADACHHTTDERRILFLDEHDLAVGHSLEFFCKPGVIGIAQRLGADDLDANPMRLRAASSRKMSAGSVTALSFVAKPAA